MKLLKWIDDYFEETLMAIMLAAITLITFVQIFMRFIIGQAMSFPEELCRYIFIWLSFLGISYSIKVGNSLKVDILETFIPKIKTVLNLIQNIVFFAFCVVMIWQGFIAVGKIVAYNQTSAAMGMPMWIVYAAFLTGCVLAILRLIQVFYKMIKSAVKKGGSEALESNQ